MATYQRFDLPSGLRVDVCSGGGPAGGIPIPGLPVPASMLEMRMGAIRVLVEQLSKEAVELTEKLEPVLGPTPSELTRKTMEDEADGPAPAPIVSQLSALESQLQSIKDQLHMLRCRACC